MNAIGKYASLVKFTHTLFALPFALVGYVYALVSTDTQFDWLLLVKILFCMVFARNTAMGFNRWADRKIDAANPRTADREIPSGRISPGAALAFTIANAIGFLIMAAFINKLTLILAPVALIVVMGYSYTKRFTAWSHLVLGAALGIAPVGAYIAVTGSLAVAPILLAGIVLTWTGGFDILYSMQDMEFDRANGLKSVPARYSANKAIWISIILHLISVYGVWIFGAWYGAGLWYWLGAGLFTAMLVLQHVAYLPSKISRVGKSFGLINGLSSVIYAAFTITDLFLKDYFTTPF